jgi:UDPglucose 6-dehydrogenase
MGSEILIIIEKDGVIDEFTIPVINNKYILVKVKDFISSLYDDFDSLKIYQDKKLLYRLSADFLKAPTTISVVGTGYVGLVSGVGLALRGRRIICVDIDQAKIDLINSKKSPIYEKDLEESLAVLPEDIFEATTDLKYSILNSDATMIAVGTPCNDEGRIDLTAMKKVSEEIGKNLKNKKGHLIIVKSTVVPGTTEDVVKKAIQKHAGHNDFEIAMVPEFLREGVAMKDFLFPDRIVIGANNPETVKKIKFIFKEFKTVFYDAEIKAAEMIKYASNSLLATKISFANEIGNVCKKLGMDVYEVMDGVGLDSRLERKFLNAGRGFGGSCFPKDVQALRSLADDLKVETMILDSVMTMNKEQPKILVDLAEKKIGNLKGKKVAVLGLAFKAGTDDIRDSPAIIVIKELLKKGAKVHGYDPQAEENMAELFPKIAYADFPQQAIKDSDVVILTTDWPILKNEELYKGKVIIDGLKLLNKKTSKNYEGICW